MKIVLIVEDDAICREPMAAMLEAKGFAPLCATNGKEALEIMQRQQPDIILLDIHLPDMDGIAFLRSVRTRAEWKEIPVVILTGVTDKNTVMMAAELGVKEYLLKDHFSIKTFLGRLQRQLSPKAAAPAAVQAAAKPVHQGDAESRQTVTTTQIPPRIRLTRQETIRRLDACKNLKALPGVVAEVIAMASSPRCEVPDLVNLLKRDPTLATRVLQMANSAAFMTKKARVTNIDEAVRNIGISTVRNIATAAGIFESLPADNFDDVDLIRCWQHALAVATLMDAFPHDEASPAGVAYLVGLCHDLGKIILRQHFKVEYAAIMACYLQTGQPQSQVEKSILGVSRAEFATLVLNKLRLPQAITDPIAEYFESDGGRTGQLGALAQRLHMANMYAHGMLLCQSVQAPIAVFTSADAASALGTTQMPRIDRDSMHNDILLITNLLAKLPPSKQQAVSEPLLPRQSVKIAYYRAPELCSFDPIHVALEMLCNVTLLEQFPAAPEILQGYHRLVIALPHGADPGTTEREMIERLKKIQGANIPVLCLTKPSETSDSSGVIHFGGEVTTPQALASFIAGEVIAAAPATSSPALAAA